ncbi:unnamed protein product [Rotaria socialis]|uniref:Protein kinase domain-containing protein n=1 Tax=Rotaria socialis TaxID=392032 RepID=A0A818W9M5_9BILA|nr:unnamed protein product [Rotaria socialis]
MIDSGAYGQVILAYDYLFQICIRWYRASELVLCDGTYTSAMDMWSVGCILGELICGQPVFPGRHYLD